MTTNEWDDLVQAAQSAAKAMGLPIGEVPLEEIARHAGLSRATLYRRIGNRQALQAAIEASGIDAESRGDVRDRATAAAAELIERDGLAAMTLEAVAVRADCSVRALHSQVGGRDGLLEAVFERFSPLPHVERAMAGGIPPLDAGARAIYGLILESVRARPGLLKALIGDVALRPSGPTAAYLRSVYLPRVLAAVGPWLKAHQQSGALRPIPPSLVLNLLIGPVGAHVLLGSALPGGKDTDPTEVRDVLTAAFVRAVARAPD